MTKLSKAANLGSGTAHEGDQSCWNGQGVWKDLLVSPSRPIRRMLVASIGINFFMQASGNDAVIYYCPEVKCSRQLAWHTQKRAPFWR